MAIRQRFRSSLTAVAVATTLLTASGCAVNPVTGENELSLVSAQQEVRIGEQQYKPQQQSMGWRYQVDPDLQVYVNKIGQKLARLSHRPNLPYEFVVLNSSVPNAWALPGGKIAINRGLLLYLEDESQLAAVLGHEIVHAAARHTAKRLSHSQLLGAGLMVLNQTTRNTQYGGLATQAGQLGAQVFLAKYGRDDELQSDQYGMEYMAKAGYDPYGAVRLQEVFVKLSEGLRSDPISALFASHPPSQSRVDANKLHAQKLPRGNTFRDRYQRAIAQLKKDEPAYKAAEEAMKLLQAKDAAGALKALDRAIAIQPSEVEFWELRGYAWQMQDNAVNAEKSFGTAIRKSPEYFKPYALRGMARLELKKYVGAEEDFKASYDILPTQTAAYYLGELALQREDIPTAKKYFEQVARGSSELSQKAQQRLKQIQQASQTTSNPQIRF